MDNADAAALPETDGEERRLIDRSAAGDQEAFRQLVLRHHRLVINVAFRALGEVSLAEDVAQEVFLKVYRALPTYRHDKPFAHWLHRVTSNAVTDFVRRRKPVISLDAFDQLPMASGSDPQDLAARHDLQRAVRDAIAALPSHYRDTISLPGLRRAQLRRDRKNARYPDGHRDVEAQRGQADPARTARTRSAERRAGEYGMNRSRLFKQRTCP